MAVREIPTKFEHVCDVCGDTKISTSKGRPQYWCDLHILRDAYDFQGAAVADGSVKRLLCQECGNAACEAVNQAIRSRSAGKAGGA